ncbi:hypothetical protein [Prochlorococcus sp. MIT 1300]|uniref:hypothetical protein n=1 Tax=Prochlorococcus sp. MIT 1300 TaxID=3096218 RepID=UPI002A74BD78|nr:hypothetical protein [Prochlorococcus sp. MIT 1300]
MILLKISNASELVASKVGKFVELLTPDQIDQTAVEEQLMKELIKNLEGEGVKGQISIVNGMEVEGQKLLLGEGLRVRKQQDF